MTRRWTLHTGCSHGRMVGRVEEPDRGRSVHYRPTSGAARTGPGRAPLLIVCLLAFGVELHAESFAARYQRRATACRRQIPAVTQAAEAAANRLLAHPEALLNIPWEGQHGFCEEMINRAGGLAHAYPSEHRSRRRRQTPNDVVLLTVRSWTESGADVLAELQRCRKQGWMVTLIASSAGRPATATADFMIDNGAPDGRAAHGAENALVNATLGWMWICEYAGAMTRQGRIPAILRSVALDEAVAPNRLVQTAEGRHTTFPVTNAVAPGSPATLYLDRIDRLIADVQSAARQQQIDKAASICAARHQSRRTVWLSGVGHLIEHEMGLNMRSPWKPLRSRTWFKRRLRATTPGDLVVWIGYIGMNSRYLDYESPLNARQLDLITCYVPAHEAERYTADTTVLRNAAHALAQIDQVWEMGDAEVPVPGPVPRMGPISGINAMLLCRMLDEAFARHVTPTNPVASTPHRAMR